MSVIEAPVVLTDGDVEVRLADGAFVARLVERLHTEYGDDPGVIRRRVDAVLASFAGARVRSFVPILVEKQVRELYRRPGSGLHV